MHLDQQLDGHLDMMAEQGPGGKKFPSVFFHVLVFFFLISGVAFAADGDVSAVSITEPTTEPTTLLGPAPPFAARDTDYAFEAGLMSSKEDLVAMGAMVGAHVGRCWLMNSEACRQYVDGIFGAGLREGETQGHFWLSPRWQFLLSSKRYSPFMRIGGGVANVASPTVHAVRGAGIAGLGVTTYLHDKVDLHFETRVVSIDKVYVQFLLGANIKIDRLLELFATKIRDLGVGTVKTAIEVTGTAIKATGEGLGGVAKGVAAPFQKEKPTPTPTPAP